MGTYTDYNNSGLDFNVSPYNSCSNNLLKLKDFLLYIYKGRYLGCRVVRPIRGGSSYSVHSWGAALDWGYDDQHKVEQEVIPFLIWTSRFKDSGIQAIHDYKNSRIWRNNRDPQTYPDGWKEFNGYGAGWAEWIHVEVNAPKHTSAVDYGKLFIEYLGLKEQVFYMSDIRVYDEGEHWRLVDTRQGSALAENETRTFSVPGGRKAILANFTVLPIEDNGYLGLWNKNTSFLNWGPVGANPPVNCLPITLRENGTFDIFCRKDCNLIIDVFGEA